MRRVINNIVSFVNRFAGRVEIPEAVLDQEETVLMHISDTPSGIYGYLYEVIDKVAPDILVHTGDLVDDIKLEHNSALLTGYRRRLPGFLSNLESRGIDTYIIPGNHDSFDVLQEVSKNSDIKKNKGDISVEGVKIGMAHYREELPEDTVVNLFGHDMQIDKGHGRLYLNGMYNVNIILFPSLKTYTIPYPPGTNRERKYNNILTPGRMSL
ncbi:MAG: metallophosphoesterase [Halanaerobiaceae bacterium]